MTFPKIAVVLGDRATFSEIRKLKNAGPLTAEIRIDRFLRFDTKYVLDQIKRFKPFPKIATIRSKSEGGQWTFPEKTRLELFKAVIPEVDAVDVELSSKKILEAVIKNAHRHKKKVIVSYHNFKKTPRSFELARILRRAKAAGADIVKLAVFANDTSDVCSLALFTSQNASNGIITIAMGKKGRSSRIFFPALGSLLTYASLGAAAAPGQFSYQETACLLKLFCPKK